MADDSSNLHPSSSGDVLREHERRHAERCKGHRIDSRCPCGLTTVSSCSCGEILTVWQLIEGVHCEHFNQFHRWLESVGSSLR